MVYVCLQTQTIPSQQEQHIYALCLRMRDLLCLAYSPDNGRTLSLFLKLFFAITSIKHGESTQLSGAEKGIRKYTAAFFAAATGPGFDDQAPLFLCTAAEKNSPT